MQRVCFITLIILSWHSVGMAANPVAHIKTSLGTIVVELNQQKAPKSTANFIQYANEKYYDGTIFHRVIKDFMIQGGGFGLDLKQKKARAPIENEAENGLKNVRGTIAMARTNMPHSATAQFFINVKNNDFLNFKAPIGNGWGYTVFGKVVDGMKIVDKIQHLQTRSAGGPFANLPKEEVRIEKVTIKQDPKKTK